MMSGKSRIICRAGFAIASGIVASDGYKVTQHLSNNTFFQLPVSSIVS